MVHDETNGHDEPHGSPADGAAVRGGMDGYDGPRAVASDPIAAVMASFFEAALVDEPESSVTAESVLREVRAQAAARPARFGSAAWFRERFSGDATGWKWAGGLVGVAAVVGALVWVGPSLVGSSTTSMAGGGNDSATAESASEMASAASDLAAADSPATAELSMDTFADGREGKGGERHVDEDRFGADDGDAASGGSDSSDAAGDSSAVAGDDSLQQPQAPIETATPSEDTAESGVADSSQAVIPPPLTDAEWAAATGALPDGLPAMRWDQTLREQGLGVFPVLGRGDHIGLGEPDLSVVVYAGADTGPGTDYPGPSDDADTVGNIAERLRHSGYVTVQVADGTRRVAVAATEQTLAAYPGIDLDAIARAVLAAS